MKTLPTIDLGGRLVGPEYPPLVVAEMSGNHNQSLERALALVDAAAAAGAHALKLQTYTPDTMTIDMKTGDFFIDDPQSLWHGQSLYELYEKAATPWAWHEPVFARCWELGLIPFSTPFDATAVDFLNDLDVPCYKISSFENTDLALIRRVAMTGKPVIISTGLASYDELQETVAVARAAGCRDLILLQCTSAYPAAPLDANIRTMVSLRRDFGCQVGISDHTAGVGVAVAAVALGAVFVEKHFTLDRQDGGVDAAFSLAPPDLRMLVDESLRAWQSLGRVTYGARANEQSSLRFRRSLYIVADVAAGEILTPANVRAIRPGMGLAPKHLDRVIGQRAVRDLSRGTPLRSEDIRRDD